VAVGSSSRDIHASATVQWPATGPRRQTLDDTATLEEWLADPRGRAALLRAVGTKSDGHPKGIAGDAGRMRVVGNFPLRSLAIFPGTGLTHEVVDAICAELTAKPTL
jgi:beta-glucosidase